MLLWICDWLGALADDPAAPSPLLRSCCGALLALGSVLALGDRAIAWLAARFREPIKSDSAALAKLHACKQSTPTMGGLLILGGLMLALLFFADLSNRWLQIAVLLGGGFAAIGAFDDWVKLSTARAGLSARTKLFAQVLVSILACLSLPAATPGSLPELTMWMPGIHDEVELGAWSLPFAVLVLVGSANAVNLTDGLDGLAAGCLAMSFAAMALLCVVVGDSASAQRYGLPYVATGSEMSVLAATACGAVLGFLSFNRHPARLFMGDAGSLPLGALLGLVAVSTQLELVLVVIGIVFVAETLSVILQVASYKLTGKRIFRCAPLHHHFQFLGWSERRTVTRFWFVGGMAAVLTLAGLAFTAMQRSPGEVQLTAKATPGDHAER